MAEEEEASERRPDTDAERLPPPPPPAEAEAEGESEERVACGERSPLATPLGVTITACVLPGGRGSRHWFD